MREMFSARARQAMTIIFKLSPCVRVCKCERPLCTSMKCMCERLYTLVYTPLQSPKVVNKCKLVGCVCASVRIERECHRPYTPQNVAPSYWRNISRSSACACALPKNYYISQIYIYMHICSKIKHFRYGQALAYTHKLSHTIHTPAHTIR